ncbi:hypothetical protein H8356DRAFT_1350665 [Neocallimastix lanati (nom. inval.)]|nr:hypothetical protein H8356DRAFT_1350665 [Neocallimastix sp. JGI-2020a]
MDHIRTRTAPGSVVQSYPMIISRASIPNKYCPNCEPERVAQVLSSQSIYEGIPGLWVCTYHVSIYILLNCNLSDVDAFAQRSLGYTGSRFKREVRNLARHFQKKGYLKNSQDTICLNILMPLRGDENKDGTHQKLIEKKKLKIDTQKL